MAPRERTRRDRVVAALLAFGALVAAGAGAWVLAFSGLAGDAGPAAAPVPSKAQLPASARGEGVPGPGQPPGTVRLPAGGTATLVRREVADDGVLPIPDGLEEATWWGVKLGAPSGAALLSGHVNWNSRLGPFDELWRTQAGQDVSVVDTTGGRWLYRVTGIVTVHKDDLPARAEELFGPDGTHRLVLVTCGGDYVGGTDGYRDNRIVIAELIAKP